MNMKLPAFLTPQYIDNFCSTLKTFWEEKFTLGEFTPMNMKTFGCRNVRKHREIKDSEKCITLDILLKIVSLTRCESHIQNQNIIW